MYVCNKMAGLRQCLRQLVDSDSDCDECITAYNTAWQILADKRPWALTPVDGRAKHPHPLCTHARPAGETTSVSEDASSHVLRNITNDAGWTHQPATPKVRQTCSRVLVSARSMQVTTPPLVEDAHSSSKPSSTASPVSLALPYHTDEDTPTRWLHDGSSGDNASLPEAHSSQSSPARTFAPQVQAALGTPQEIVDALANLDVERIQVPHGAAWLEQYLQDHALIEV